MLSLALYKGPPENDLVHSIGHYSTRLWTWSRYSHSEIVVNGVCYSSSSRDGGVRKKVIDLTTGRWDVFDITNDPIVISSAMYWFQEHEGCEYDYRNILRFIVPIVGHAEKKFVCYEACGEMLSIPNAYKLTAETLLENAIRLHTRKDYL